MRSLSLIPRFTLLCLLLTGLWACKKEESTNNPNGNPGGGNTPTQVLVIENGARTLQPDQSLTYSAVLVSSSGVTPATGVTWSSSSTGVAEINSSGVLVVKGTGHTTITASVSSGGVTYTASVPLGIRLPGVFAVAPSAVVITPNNQIQLETVFFGQGNTNYTYTSSNTNVVEVSSTGLANFKNTGEAQITVTASTQPDNPFIIPVLVVGAPTVSLPVTRVAVTPANGEIFRGENLTLTAKAYDGNNAEVSRTFAWSTSDANIATISSTGILTGTGIGNVTVFAKTDGIIGQAEVLVNPDTIIIVEPFQFSLAPGATKQFTAKAYNLRTNTLLTGITNFIWEVPTYGIPIFDIATVNSTGLVTMRSTATPGLATMVIARTNSPTVMEGGATLTVSMSQGEDCGTGNPDVATINVAQGNTINLSLISTPMVSLTVSALDGTGNPVSGDPALKYNSSNINVATVGTDGTVTATGQGTATITICSGTFASKTVTVNVSL